VLSVICFSGDITVYVPYVHLVKFNYLFIIIFYSYVMLPTWWNKIEYICRLVAEDLQWPVVDATCELNVSTKCGNSVELQKYLQGCNTAKYFFSVAQFCFYIYRLNAQSTCSCIQSEVLAPPLPVCRFCFSFSAFLANKHVYKTHFVVSYSLLHCSRIP